MRVSELVGLNLSDLRKKEKTLRLLGKGNKERIIYVNEACLQAMEAYEPVRARFSRTGIAPMNRRCFSQNGAAGSLPAGWNRFSKNIWLLPVYPGGATPLTNCAIQPQH